MNSDDAKAFWELISAKIESKFKEQSDKHSSMYACLAIVTQIAVSGAVSVRLLSSPSDGSQDFVARNHSGSVLAVGDSVWLHYWGDYTNAYIAVRNMGDTSTDITATGIGALSYAEAQTLTAGQKTQVLANAGAAAASHASQHLIGETDALNAMPYDMISSNLLINGGFLIWQRGTSFTATGYTADRWKLTLGTGMAITLTQQAFTAGQTDVPGEPTYYAQLAISNAGSSDGLFGQRIEDVRTGAGSYITYSFYAKCNATTYAAKMQFTQSFGTGGSSDASSTAQDITITTSWQKFTGTFSLGSISGKTIGAGNYLSVKMILPTASGTKTLSIANCQINYGSKALPFVLRTYSDTLRTCRRYYQIIPTIWSTYVPSVNGVEFGNCVFPVEMRSTPTITVNSRPNLSGTDNNLDRYGTGNTSVSGATITASSSSMTSIVKTGAFVTTALYRGSLKLDAEL